MTLGSVRDLRRIRHPRPARRPRTGSQPGSSAAAMETDNRCERHGAAPITNSRCYANGKCSWFPERRNSHANLPAPRKSRESWVSSLFASPQKIFL